MENKLKKHPLFKKHTMTSENNMFFGITEIAFDTILQH